MRLFSPRIRPELTELVARKPCRGLTICRILTGCCWTPRVHVEETQEAVKKIQSFTRMILAKRELVKKKEAAVKIQKPELKDQLPQDNLRTLVNKEYDRLTKVTHPNNTSIRYLLINLKDTLSPDDLGTLVNKEYDRLTKVTYPDTSIREFLLDLKDTLSPDDLGTLVNKEYDRLTKVTHPNNTGIREFLLDLKDTLSPDDLGTLVNKEYDRLTKVTHPNNLSIRYLLINLKDTLPQEYILHLIHQEISRFDKLNDDFSNKKIWIRDLLIQLSSPELKQFLVDRKRLETQRTQQNEDLTTIKLIFYKNQVRSLDQTSIVRLFNPLFNLSQIEEELGKIEDLKQLLSQYNVDLN